MALGHLISLPSRRASDENGQGETTHTGLCTTAGPSTQRGALPARLPSPEGLCQPTAFISTLPLFQGHLPREAFPKHSAQALPPPLKLLFFVPLFLSNIFHKHC